MSTSSDIAYIVGLGGLGLAVLREWMAARERRRARPVVITHEDQKRTLRNGQQVASVHITNESAVSAFNIRFGIYIRGVPVAWKHSKDDPEPSRLNVLPPNAREPPRGVGTGEFEIVIPDAVLWSIGAKRDPDEGRAYWAYYQAPGGDWWHTSNPATRSDDLKITRLRSRRFGVLAWRNRRLDRRLRTGEKVLSTAIKELREGAQQHDADD
jgi:hypothetical protein